MFSSRGRDIIFKGQSQSLSSFENWYRQQAFGTPCSVHKVIGEAEQDYRIEIRGFSLFGVQINLFAIDGC